VESLEVIDQPCQEVLIGDNMSVDLLGDSTIFDVEQYEDSVREMGLDGKDELNDQGMTDKLSNGLYGRRLFIPKGSFITGALHKNDYIDIFISGDITLKSYFANGEIEEVTRVNEFQFMEGKAGRKRVGYAHEDTVWLTVDPTNEVSIEEAREEVAVMSHTDYLKHNKEIAK